MKVDFTRRVRAIDAHAGGEPTRIIIEGGPDLGNGNVTEKIKLFQTHYDFFRDSVIGEPRGYDSLVGALLCEPGDPSCVTGVIFFNNQGYLGMCGHGTMCVAVALAHLGRIKAGQYKIETPVGIIEFYYDGGSNVTVVNVPSYRYAKDIVIDVQGYGKIRGDIAWGGNWFFLTDNHGLELSLDEVDQLRIFAQCVRRALQQSGFTGPNDAEIDHIILFGPSPRPIADSRNFVLCPGGAYDRSPCGTGTSAMTACLIADGKLKPNEIWRQESIIGSVFEAWGKIDEQGRVIPFIRGNAFVTAELTILFHRNDPFKMGVRHFMKGKFMSF
ncbi:MAG: proline racemase family protein [Candidatus Methanomethyliaceae archaeon]